MRLLQKTHHIISSYVCNERYIGIQSIIKTYTETATIKWTFWKHLLNNKKLCSVYGRYCNSHHRFPSVLGPWFDWFLQKYHMISPFASPIGTLNITNSMNNYPCCSVIAAEPNLSYSKSALVLGWKSSWWDEWKTCFRSKPYFSSFGLIWVLRDSRYCRELSYLMTMSYGRGSGLCVPNLVVIEMLYRGELRKSQRHKEKDGINANQMHFFTKRLSPRLITFKAFGLLLNLLNAFFFILIDWGQINMNA